MIRYALKCSDGHSFESWFQSSDAFEALASKGMVNCAICGSSDVSKAMMAPRVTVTEETAKPGSADVKVPAAPTRPLTQAPAHPAEQMLRALREHVEKHSTYVGGNFAAEARAMHLGEMDQRPIHGEATPDEARSLIEDGVEIAPLPIVPPDRAN